MNRRELIAAMAAAAGMGVQARAAGEKTLAERLGYAPDARLLMIHADDIGMCHSVNRASARAMTEGVVSSGSAMAPCPWFPELVTWAKEHPEADLGLHLTLTSEWRHYRWRPLSPPDRVKGLIDLDGFMWRSVADVRRHAKPEEVETEIRTQIEYARKWGLKLTHVDSHMGTLFADPGFFQAYVRVAKEQDVMPMLPGPTPEILLQARALGLDYLALVKQLQGQGYVVLDRLVTSLEGETYEARKREFGQFVRGLKPGVTELIVHLSGDEEEIRNITGNWGNRYNEYRLFTEPESKALLKEQGVELVGYRKLASLWRK